MSSNDRNWVIMKVGGPKINGPELSCVGEPCPSQAISLLLGREHMSVSAISTSRSLLIGQKSLTKIIFNLYLQDRMSDIKLLFI